MDQVTRSVKGSRPAEIRIRNIDPLPCAPTLSLVHRHGNVGPWKGDGYVWRYTRSAGTAHAWRRLRRSHHRGWGSCRAPPQQQSSRRSPEPARVTHFASPWTSGTADRRGSGAAGRSGHGLGGGARSARGHSRACIDQTFIKTTSDATRLDAQGAFGARRGSARTSTRSRRRKIGDSLSKVVQTMQLPSADLPLIDGSIGTLKAAIPSATGVNGSGVLESLKVGLPLDQLPPASSRTSLEQLTDAVDEHHRRSSMACSTASSAKRWTDLVGDLTDQIVDLAGGTHGLAGLLGGIAGRSRHSPWPTWTTRQRCTARSTACSTRQLCSTRSPTC